MTAANFKVTSIIRPLEVLALWILVTRSELKRISGNDIIWSEVGPGLGGPGGTPPPRIPRSTPAPGIF